MRQFKTVGMMLALLVSGAFSAGAAPGRAGGDWQDQAIKQGGKLIGQMRSYQRLEKEKIAMAGAFPSLLQLREIPTVSGDGGNVLTLKQANRFLQSPAFEQEDLRAEANGIHVCGFNRADGSYCLLLVRRTLENYAGSLKLEQAPRKREFGIRTGLFAELPFSQSGDLVTQRIVWKGRLGDGDERISVNIQKVWSKHWARNAKIPVSYSF
ncbi:MAG: hypothetical protein KGO96_09355 [Elusimicrobia bacterium]|nr:hypothetical protein [Elusimicrobiota bacterium]MDE2426095.1 hypothetical protein [Elusimicrobiota bacterium]